MKIEDQLDWLCRKIIVHSIIYYDLNENIVSDKEDNE